MNPVKLVLSSLLLLASGLLRAHTHLETSVPADGAVLSEGPATLELSFGDEVQLLRLGFTVVTATDDTVKPDFQPSATAAKTFSIPLPALASGAYTVSWTVLGADGHRIEGHFSFTIDPAAAASASATAPHDH